MKMRWLPTACGLVLLAFAAGTAAPPAADDPDDEEREYQAAVSRRALQENCLICHSEEMISSQRLTPAQWKTEVEKMVGWGSPLPSELQQPLIDYLSNQYSDRSPKVSPVRITYETAWKQVRPEAAAGDNAVGAAASGERLFVAHCATCHGKDAQGTELGPNIVEKTILLRPADYHELVRKGRRRMPGFQLAIKPTEEADVLAWLKQRRYIPPPPK